METPSNGSHPGAQAGRHVSLRLHGGEQAPGAARALAVQAAARRLDDEGCETLALLVSEVVTNAVLHGGMGPDEEIALDVDLMPGRVRVAVKDEGPGFGRAPERPGRPGGWGLHLVSQLADRWAIERDDGTRVWFELAC